MASAVRIETKGNGARAGTLGGEGPVVVDGRFCGPPEAGNGGYVVGLLAERLGASITATLRRPVPLGQPLDFRPDPDRRGGALVDAGGAVLVEGSAGGADVALPAPVSFSQAVAASRVPLFDAARHPCPACFVCGTSRRPGDGLCIFPGPVAGRAVVAAPWRPGRALAGTDGHVDPRFQWAALDCPGGIAAVADAPRPILLGRLSGTVALRVRAGERCVLVGWPIARDGRKHRAGSALFDAKGRVCAWSEQVWIEPRSER